jgi:predicted  nucleic acid-binding Zn-ribbon protein
MAKLFLYPPTPLDKTGLATEAKQDAQITELQNIVTEINNLELDVENINVNVDGLETLVAASNVQLTAINANTDNIEADLVAIAGYVDNIEANQATAQTTLTSIDTSTNNIETDVDSLNAKLAAGLVPESHDYISMTYVGATTDIDVVTYKTGGVAGTTVATLTLGYDGSNRLTSVTRS